MEAGYKVTLENPLAKANFASKLFFSWMIKLCYKGTKKDLEISDLYKILTSDKSESLGDKLELNWNNEIAKAKEEDRKPSLLNALTKTFFWSYMYYGLLVFFLTLPLRACQPLVLGYLITLFSKPESKNNTIAMCIFASILVIMSLFIVFLWHHTHYGQSIIGMRIRIAVSSLAYRKIMKLDRKSLGQTAAGKIVNLLSNDVSRFDLVMISLHYIWIMPFQVILIAFFIWQEVGISSLTGILSMALLALPVQFYLGTLTSQLRLKVAVRTDRRVKLMSEVIQGIQVIKMYAWEKSFEKVINLTRAKEIVFLTKTSYLRGIYFSCMVFIEKCALFVTVICYVLLGNTITADIVFSMAQFFNVLQFVMAVVYPMAISYGAETLVSIKRLQDFLLLDEIKQSTIEPHNEKEVEISKLRAGWLPTSNTLQDINLKIPAGALCAIVGPVGSGKTSLIQILLGELSPLCGQIKIGGTMSYSSQEPWLFGSTVRTNILFGQEYNIDRYWKIIKICALEKDLEQFPEGDKTIVGERGVILSGGQRARINLARAIYRDADIYLMDDPLSAVDTRVGKHLFNECICKYLKYKTRILVTHQLHYLKKADLIVVLNEGRIEAQGSFEQLTNSGLDYTKFLVDSDETAGNELRSPKAITSRKFAILPKGSPETSKPKKNEESERKDLSPLKEYFKATGNSCLVVLLIVLLVLGQTLCSSVDYWVAFWTEQEASRHSNSMKFHVKATDYPVIDKIDVYSIDNHTNDWNNTFYSYKPDPTIPNWENMTALANDTTYNLIKTDLAIYIYAGLLIAAITITMMRSFLFFKVAMMSSKNLHSKMFHSLLKTPMRFFDTNPSGRVLNRFSKDVGSIDEILPRTLMDAIQITLIMCGILVNVTISNPYTFIATVILGVVFIKLRNWYIAIAKDIKHLEGTTKSPVFSHITSSLNGLTTIRASRTESIVIKEFDDHQDVHTSAWFLVMSATDCYGLWLDIVCVVFIAVVCMSFIVLRQFEMVSGSLVGLALSQALILTGMLQFGMMQTAEIINQLTSVERVLQYTTLDKEGPFETPKENLPELPWPNKGLIEFKDVFLKYVLDDPSVLKDLHFTIFPGEKIGIVGRTGAGKSSLVSALFRLAPFEGSIEIDGIDTKTIGLNDLRKSVSIIPQEPVLFSATLRYNLDPFNEFEDHKLWNALEEVELRCIADSLDFMVSEGGSNFSLGQRQLLCLARAILRNNKILILDEATANVDPQTDILIQSTIRKKFQFCTVVTIAHRLNTIMDSDKVLVMDGGRMIEFDHSHILLQNSKGHFYKMVQETGTVMALQLKDMAAEAYRKRSF